MKMLNSRGVQNGTPFEITVSPSDFSFEGEKMPLIDHEGMWWWGIKEVCGALRISNHKREFARILQEEKRVFSYKADKGGFQEKQFINIFGVWDLLIKSKATGARAFRARLKDVMLSGMTAEDERFKGAFKDLTRIAAKYEEKAKAYDSFMSHPEGFPVQTAVKMMNIGIGRNKFFQWLRDHNYVMSHPNPHNEPNQKYIDRGWFIPILTSPHGKLKPSTLITTKGMVKLKEAYLKDQS